MKQPTNLDASKVTCSWHGIVQPSKVMLTLSQLMLSSWQVTPGMFDEHYVSSSRVHTARGVRGPRLPLACWREAERLVVAEGGHGGSLLQPGRGVWRAAIIKFLPLWHLPSKRFSIWVSEEHFLFDKPLSTLLTAPEMARNWPDAGDLVRRGKSWAQQIECFEENGVIQPEWPSTWTVLFPQVEPPEVRERPEDYFLEAWVKYLLYPSAHHQTQTTV